MLKKSKGDFPDTEANNEKARRRLQWNPGVTVDEGLKRFIEWFLSEVETEKGSASNISTNN
jgi:nucleoside-diphosphate-sugar epimerase